MWNNEGLYYQREERYISIIKEGYVVAIGLG